MQSITLKSHIGSDGILQLQLPDELRNQNVTIVIQPQQEDWRSVLQSTAGSISDLEHPLQGE